MGQAVRLTGLVAPIPAMLRRVSGAPNDGIAAAGLDRARPGGAG